MQTSNNSTYSLIVRSEEKSRSILEVVLYAFFILSAVVSIWQFARQPVEVPAAGLHPKSVNSQLACVGGNCAGLSKI
jgi:hypothetical protein